MISSLTVANYTDAYVTVVAIISCICRVWYLASTPECYMSTSSSGIYSFKFPTTSCIMTLGQLL